MTQRLVPDQIYLVCSEGMNMQQLKVTSQTTLFMQGQRLVATHEDRMNGNFNCAAMVVAGAIIGAAIASIVAICFFATAGLSAVAFGAIAAGGAATGAGFGLLGGLIPSICSCLTQEWIPVHPQICINGKPLYPLLENSIIPCRLGGIVSIYYSQKAAQAAIDYTRWDTGLQVLENAIGAFIGGCLGGAVSGGFISQFSTKVFINASVRSLPGIGLSFISDRILNEVKDNLLYPKGYKDMINLDSTKSYDIKNKTMAAPTNKEIDNAHEKAATDQKQIIGTIKDATSLSKTHIKKTESSIKSHTSNYDYNKTTITYSLADMYDMEMFSVSDKKKNTIKNKNPHTTTTTTILEQEPIEGYEYLGKKEVVTEQGKQYEPLTRSDIKMSNLSKKSIIEGCKKNIFTKDSPVANFLSSTAKGFLGKLGTDAIMAGLNATILQSKINNLTEGLKDEEKERNKITVQEHTI